MQKPITEDDVCTVYFDGTCPLCRAEIGYYQSKGSDAVFKDLSENPDLPDGLENDTAMRRFHVTNRDGQLISGAAAFAELWKVTPGWGWLGRWASGRPQIWIAEGLYRLFLNIRPCIQSVYRKFVQSNFEPPNNTKS